MRKPRKRKELLNFEKISCDGDEEMMSDK